MSLLRELSLRKNTREVNGYNGDHDCIMRGTPDIRFHLRRECDAMTAKEYLSQIAVLDIKIEQLQKEINNLTVMQGIGSMDYSQDRVQTSSNGYGFTTLSEKKVDTEEEYEKLIDTYISKRFEIIGQIQQLSRSEYIDILYDRYCSKPKMSFEEIAVKMSYSYNYVCNLHGEALKEFEREFQYVLNKS